MAININHVKNTFCGSSGIFVFGTGIVSENQNTLYSANFCAYNGKFYGDGSAITGLATGSFITTGQTGAFGGGGGNIDTSSFVTTGQTGNFLTSSSTGDFITYLDTGILVGKNQTGNFVLKNQTGSFVTTGQTGSFVTNNQTGSICTAVLSRLYLDEEYFSYSNDSFVCSLAARKATTNSNETYLERNNSICLFQLEPGDHITFSASVNLAGCSTESHGYFKIDGSARRYMFLDGGLTSTCSQLNNNIVKQTYSTSYSGYSATAEIDNTSHSLRIKVVGDSVDRQQWFAKVDVLKNNYIVNSEIVLPETLYFSGNTSDYNWFNYRNWYTNSQLTSRSLSFAQTGNIAIICGNKGPIINLSCNYWYTPKLINALNLTDDNGVCFFSPLNQQIGFSGIVSGSASFYGGSYLI
jgi:hypothetical protein